MKLKIDEYEVKISAGRKGNYNEYDTKTLLNLLCIMAYEAGDMCEIKERPWCAEQARRIADGIHETLKRKGFFDGISI